VEYEFPTSSTFSFGEINAMVGFDGPVDDPQALGDRLVATIAALGSIEGLRTLQGAPNGKGTAQECVVNLTFGAISMLVKIGFKLNHDVSNKTLNKIVLGEIMSRIWAEAAAHFSGVKPQHLPSRSVDYIDQALGLDTMAASGQRSAATNGHGNGGTRRGQGQGQRQRQHARR
jgi:hypothetical protein